MPGANDHHRAVDVLVEADAIESGLGHLWTSIGYDEINWTYTPQGRSLLRTLGELEDAPYLVRSHYMFTSGTGARDSHIGGGQCVLRVARREPSVRLPDP